MINVKGSIRIKSRPVVADAICAAHPTAISIVTAGCLYGFPRSRDAGALIIGDTAKSHACARFATVRWNFWNLLIHRIANLEYVFGFLDVRRPHLQVSISAIVHQDHCLPWINTGCMVMAHCSRIESLE